MARGIALVTSMSAKLMVATVVPETSGAILPGGPSERDLASAHGDSEHEDRDPPVRRPPLVLRPAGVDPQALLPDPIASLALRLDGAEAPGLPSTAISPPGRREGCGTRPVAGLSVVGGDHPRCRRGVGRPRTGTVRSRPLRAPVVVSITTGRPETRAANRVPAPGESVPPGGRCDEGCARTATSRAAGGKPAQEASGSRWHGSWGVSVIGVLRPLAAVRPSHDLGSLSSRTPLNEAARTVPSWVQQELDLADGHRLDPGSGPAREPGPRISLADPSPCTSNGLPPAAGAPAGLSAPERRWRNPVRRRRRGRAAAGGRGRRPPWGRIPGRPGVARRGGAAASPGM